MNTGSTLQGFQWLQKTEAPIIKTNRLAYIGLRDIDEAERKILKDLNIATFTMNEIVEYGIAAVTAMAINAIDPEGKVPIHLSFDIDALDPLLAPSTGTPVIGGLLEREGKYVCETLAKTGRLVSMDLVEVNPSLGNETDQKRTVAAAQSIIYSALGRTYL